MKRRNERSTLENFSSLSNTALTNKLVEVEGMRRADAEDAVRNYRYRTERRRSRAGFKNAVKIRRIDGVVQRYYVGKRARVRKVQYRFKHKEKPDDELIEPQEVKFEFKNEDNRGLVFSPADIESALMELEDEGRITKEEINQIHKISDVKSYGGGHTASANPKTNQISIPIKLFRPHPTDKEEDQFIFLKDIQEKPLDEVKIDSEHPDFDRNKEIEVFLKKRAELREELPRVLLHELGHIKYKHKLLPTGIAAYNKQEKEADDFAAERLRPTKFDLPVEETYRGPKVRYGWQARDKARAEGVYIEPVEPKKPNKLTHPYDNTEFRYDERSWEQRNADRQAEKLAKSQRSIRAEKLSRRPVKLPSFIYEEVEIKKPQRQTTLLEHRRIKRKGI